jgi:hypothetical protein
MGSHLCTERHIEERDEPGRAHLHMSIRLKSKSERVYASGDALMP